MVRRNWKREELLLVLNLYCRLPFGQYDRHNFEIINLAGFIGRTPSAIAMKLSNFASFDPYHQSRGIRGLSNSSKADRDIWNEFNANWDDLAIESEIIYAQLLGEVDVMKTVGPEMNNEILHFSGSTEIERQVKVRLGQSFFRKVILTSYKSKCCVCGIPIPELLIASHIVPWRDDEHSRVNPHNGLCLCVLHDKGFDRGFFTVGEDYKVMIGKAIHQYPSNAALYNGFAAYEGQEIMLPDKFIPDQRFLTIHRTNYFLG